jgi:hypothetical protein
VTGLLNRESRQASRVSHQGSPAASASRQHSGAKSVTQRQRPQPQLPEGAGRGRRCRTGAAPFSNWSLTRWPQPSLLSSTQVASQFRPIRVTERAINKQRPQPMVTGALCARAMHGGARPRMSELSRHYRNGPVAPAHEVQQVRRPPTQRNAWSPNPRFWRSGPAPALTRFSESHYGILEPAYRRWLVSRIWWNPTVPLCLFSLGNLGLVVWTRNAWVVQSRGVS